jgi:hypothetical protein
MISIFDSYSNRLDSFPVVAHHGRGVVPVEQLTFRPEKVQ